MDELIQFSLIRKDIYRLLSVPFHKEPSKNYLEDMKKKFDIAAGIGDIRSNQHTAEGAEILRNYFQKPTDDAEIEELACAYARLFLVADMKAGLKGVSPHESVYTSPQGLVMQEARDEVMEVYYSQGLGSNSEVFTEMEDHISAELDFMANMAAKMAEALTNNDSDALIAIIKVQTDFLNDHLLKWIDKLAADVVEVSPSDFYKGLARLTQGFVHSDNEILLELIKPQ